ncbi:hypothetical protein CEE37_14175 [candidate division LCP-89 bacterium B3_LCP]|uniref:Uncharacterized protein n=1 Tax=candidate division LCP-89 bacterium B3_LCP TaxID=2012998 RepID=A0A532UQP2_UNCL8|nr:MAG: hypothetical protein CEE37_14175 [candidate division LCP-89 bacterium B3_LCP]
MPNPVKVLHVTTSLSRNGGIEETLRVLCKRLQGYEFQFAICSVLGSSKSVLDDFRDTDIPLFFGKYRGSVIDIRTTMWVRKVAKEFGANIIHTHNNKGNYHGRLAAKLAGNIPSVTTHHDMGDIRFSKTFQADKRPQGKFDDQGQELHDWIATFVWPFLNVNMDCLNSRVICVSNAVRNIHTPDPNDERFKIVYAPYDETIFNAPRQVTEKETITIGTVGRLVPQKGYPYLLEAFKELRTSVEHIRLRITGEGLFRPHLEELIRKNNLEEKVTLCGEHPHDAALYDGIDIYVQPSVSEGCSITLLEAMGMGLPVVASDLDGPREIVLNNETGVLVPPKDSSALSDAILGLIRNPVRAAKLGKAAQERARREFSSEAFAARMADIYREVILK